jgi:hypothetical protein
MISSFSQYLVEEERVVYFTFGRMNPPTIGHGKLLDALARKAGRNPYKVYLSQSNNNKKDPIPYANKIKHVRKMFPKHGRSIVVNKKVINPFYALSDLYDQGFRQVIMVAGSDRVQEYDLRLNKYNGKKGGHGFYNFKGGVKIVSAGARDADAEGAEGASGTKQREYVTTNDFAGFSQGLPKKMSTADARKLFNDVRKGMGLKEEKTFKNHIRLESVSDRREQYISGTLFSVSDEVVIKETNDVGVIKVIGSNYVIVEFNGQRKRCWLDAVEKIQESYSPQTHEEGTPAASQRAKMLTPGQTEEKQDSFSRVDLAKSRIDREKRSDTKKHARMVYLAKVRDTAKKDKKENFKDGKNPERKGLAKRSGVDTKASVSDLRKKAKNSTGETQRMAHWLANMKSGKKK